jgi:hypothetical protein
VLFPPFTGNEADPLHVFSDAVVHKDVFDKHPLASKVLARIAEGRARTAALRCLICGERITKPDDHLGLAYLVEDPDHPLFQFNYAQFHRSHLAKWPQRPWLLTELDALFESGAWKGEGPKRLIAMMRAL